jgi:hypothetical protein
MSGKREHSIIPEASFSAGSTGPSDRNIVRRAFLSGPAAFVVDLGGSDVAVAEQFLNLADVDAGVKQQRRPGCAERMGAEDARSFFDSTGSFAR